MQMNMVSTHHSGWWSLLGSLWVRALGWWSRSRWACNKVERYISLI